MLRRIKTPYHAQENEYYCGPACLQMVFGYFGHPLTQKMLAEHMGAHPKTGTPNEALERCVSAQGFFSYTKTDATNEDLRDFLKQELPVIVNFIEPSHDEGHFAVVTKLTRRTITLNDPWNGKNYRLPWKEFVQRWQGEIGGQNRWMMAIDRKPIYPESRTGSRRRS